MLAASLVIFALSRGLDGAPPPNGPDRTRLCIENAVDGLVGAWLWYQHKPFASLIIAPMKTDCISVGGYSQWISVFVGKGARDVPGTAVLFPDRVDKQMGAACPSYIEGGQLRFKVTKRDQTYQCRDVR